MTRMQASHYLDWSRQGWPAAWRYLLAIVLAFVVWMWGSIIPMVALSAVGISVLENSVAFLYTFVFAHLGVLLIVRLLLGRRMYSVALPSWRRDRLGVDRVAYRFPRRADGAPFHEQRVPVAVRADEGRRPSGTGAVRRGDSLDRTRLCVRRRSGAPLHPGSRGFHAATDEHGDGKSRVGAELPPAQRRAASRKACGGTPATRRNARVKLEASR